MKFTLIHFFRFCNAACAKPDPYSNQTLELPSAGLRQNDVFTLTQRVFRTTNAIIQNSQWFLHKYAKRYNNHVCVCNNYTLVNYLVERSAHINWTALDDLINDIRDRLHEVWISKLESTHSHVRYYYLCSFVFISMCRH